MEKFLIVGLGNMGSEFAHTRHNIGFDVLDVLAEELNVTFEPQRYGDVAKGRLRGRMVILLKPSTYMNLSGKAVRYWLQQENIAIDKLIVITDDLALPLGMLRMRKKGSDGGHNGLANINELLNTTQYTRLRFGIGNGFSKGHQIDYVLSRWSDEHLPLLKEKMAKSSKMCKSFVLEGVDITMNRFNERIAINKSDESSENVI